MKKPIYLLLIIPLMAHGTCFINGSLHYQNEIMTVPTIIPHTISDKLPKTPELEKWLSELPPCSANGQGQPVYQIIDKQLFLTNLNYCSSGSEAVDLKKLFPDLWQQQDLENRQIWQNQLTWWQKILQYFNLLEPYQADNKLKATWFNGELAAYTGKPSELNCALPDTEYVFSVQKGQIQQVKIRKNPYFINLSGSLKTNFSTKPLY